MIIEEYVVLEVLTATTLAELHALPHYNLLPAHHRFIRGTDTQRPDFAFSLPFEVPVSG